MRRNSLGKRHKSVPNLATSLCLFCEQINWLYSIRSRILPNSSHVLSEQDEIKWKILGLYFWNHFLFEMVWLMFGAKSQRIFYISNYRAWYNTIFSKLNLLSLILQALFLCPLPLKKTILQEKQVWTWGFCFFGQLNDLIG